MSPRVVVVDDSVTARRALRHALESDPEIHVVGEAEDCATALALVQTLRPDLVTMDIGLRREDGIEVAATLMTHAPVPILIVTAQDVQDGQLAYQAIEVGALDVCGKLPALSHPSYEAQRQRFVRLVRSLAQVPVVRRRRASVAARAALRRVAPTPTSRGLEAPTSSPGYSAHPRAIEVALLGASTGGPPVLAEILRHVRTPAPRPIVIVQHMAAGFGEGFAAWLATVTGHRTLIVQRPEVLQPGVVYLAPAALHLVLLDRRLLGLSDAVPAHYQKPSIDVLFASAAEKIGAPLVAALLTGMGADGAEGLLALREAGAHTLAQTPSSCAVSSMPEAAIDAGGALEVLDPEQIGERLNVVCVT